MSDILKKNKWWVIFWSVGFVWILLEYWFFWRVTNSVGVICSIDSKCLGIPVETMLIYESIITSAFVYALLIVLGSQLLKQISDIIQTKRKHPD